MRQKRNKNVVVVEKNTHNNLLTGMFLGFLGYIAFDLYRDEKKRKYLVRDLKDFSKQLQPYIEELKNKAGEDAEIKQAIKSLDSSFGINLYDYIFRQKPKLKGPKPKTKSTTNSIRKFFKLK